MGGTEGEFRGHSRVDSSCAVAASCCASCPRSSGCASFPRPAPCACRIFVCGTLCLIISVSSECTEDCGLEGNEAASEGAGFRALTLGRRGVDESFMMLGEGNTLYT